MLMPTPRPPADDRDGLWLPAGRYEVRIDDEAHCTDRRTL